MIKEIEKIYAADSTDKLKDILSNILGGYDVPHFLYGIRIPQINNKTKDLIVSIYPNGWMEHYMKSNYIETDSVLHYSLNNNLPVTWTDELFENSKNSKLMRDESKEVGLEYGISFPIHSASGENGIFSMATPTKKAINNEVYFLMSALLPYIHEKIKELERGNKFYPKIPELSARELEVLKWTAIGKTASEISSILNITERTVVFHVTKINKKFKCNTKRQSVAYALTHKIIQF